MPPKLNRFELFVRDLCAVRVGPFVEFRVDLQAPRCCRGTDETYDHREARQRAPAPISGDLAPHPMLDLVPLACTRRKVAYRDLEAGRISKLLQLQTP